MECLSPAELYQFLTMIDAAVTFITQKLIIVHSTAGDVTWTFKEGLFCPNQGVKL